MRRHIEYFKYILRHKWFVFWACLRLGVPIWQALVHDLSKFSIHEWRPYAETFFNQDGTRIDIRKSGSYDPNNIGLVTDFSYAWIHHQRNKHHWQAWISIGDEGNLKPVPMPDKYIREMLADWSGAGMAISGKSNPSEWYWYNQDKMILHIKTKVLVEKYMKEYFGKR